MSQQFTSVQHLYLLHLLSKDSAEKSLANSRCGIHSKNTGIGLAASRSPRIIASRATRDIDS